MNTLPHPTVAYFSAEYAIADDLPIYAGGLGILAADIVMEAARQNLPFYAVGLVYHEAFTGDDPDQRPMIERLRGDGFELAVDANGQRLTVHVNVAGRQVALQAWTKHWGQTHLILLDARMPENDARDQAISDHLYAKDLQLQLAQEICLGFGGVAMLAAMEAYPDVYHLNEGHTALAGLAVICQHMRENPGMSFDEARQAARAKLAGTKHTILAGAGILLDWNSTAVQLEPALNSYGIELEDLKAVAGKPNGDYSDTKLLVGIVHRASGVSKIHVAAEKHDHPNSKLVPITNGVYDGRWAAPAWDGRPLDYDDAKFWAIHNENKRHLLEYVNSQTGVQLSEDVLTVVWARRMTAYKRPGLLVSDVERLEHLAHNAERPVQFIVAGRANPADEEGVALMNRVIAASRRPELTGRFAYLPHYNPVVAKYLVQGADLWLNTPVRGYEACGTSGMKASLNGALQFSTSDGWIDEVAIEPIGWILPEEEPATALYDILEHQAAPLFYEQTYGLPHGWILKMRANMKLAQEQFTAKRMLGDYYSELY